MEVTKYVHGRPSWTEVALSDPEGGLRFYTAVFGWKPTQSGTGADGSVIFTKDGKHVAGMRGACQPGSGTWTTFFNVDDADEVAANVRAAGGTVLEEPTDVGTAGRTARFVDLTGAEFAVWQPRDHIGAALLNEPGAFISSELGTSDAATSKAFYSRVFGWQWVGDDDYPRAAVNGTFIAGIMPVASFARYGRPPAPDYWLVCFASNQVDELVEHAAGLGATVLCAPYTNPHGKRYAILADPENAPFGVYDY